MVVRQLNAGEARWIAIHAQLLDAPRPADLVDVVERLTILQIGPTAAIAPSAGLVLWGRLDSYDPADLVRAIEQDRGVARDQRAIPSRPPRAVGNRGPLLSRDIPDTAVEPWPSSGWTNNRNITRMLEALALRGEVAISGRRGRQRYWDLPQRVYPPGLPALDLGAAERRWGYSPSRSSTVTGSSASSTRARTARPAGWSSTRSTRTSASPRP